MKSRCSVCGYFFDEKNEDRSLTEQESGQVCKQPRERFEPIQEEEKDIVNDNNLFATSSSVCSCRILYTPSLFARSSLLHLQEVGSLTAIKPHTSKREKLQSYLCFVVEAGEGELVYEGKKYTLKIGDVVFIDCRKAYSHSTDTILWTLRWCHFYGSVMSSVYDKYRERGGKPVFHSENSQEFIHLLTDLYSLAASTDYIRDMRINEKLNVLLTLLMEQSWHPESGTLSKKRIELENVRTYLDEHYVEKISLDDLSDRFFINKYYLTRIFKETYGTTISHYVLSKRITRAKQLIRFSEMTMDEIATAVGMYDANYFSRAFRKIEGVSPTEYQKQW